ncbi:MAG: hypothetical protein JXA81_04260 [Sedimentisphaerales bacterium]|nr:hypothetical protein [Sedimentisphaerales bacterium]
MTDKEKEFENFARDVRFDDTPDYNHRDKLEEYLFATLSVQFRQKPKNRKIWRTIMKTKITKVAAAVIVVAMLVGVYQIDATRAAFARTTKIVSTGLAGLKEFILDMKTREPEPLSAVPPADSSKKTAFKGRRLLANVQTFSVESEQRNLQNFFEAEGIEWTLAENNPNTWYTKLTPGKTERFIGMTQAASGLNLISSPAIMVREGEEAIIGSIGTEGQDAVAMALLATIPDDDDSIDLSFSFLHGQNGFEVPSLRIDMDAAVLFRLLTAFAQDVQNEQDRHDSRDYMLVLVKTKVLSQT